MVTATDETNKKIMQKAVDYNKIGKMNQMEISFQVSAHTKRKHTRNANTTLYMYSVRFSFWKVESHLLVVVFTLNLFVIMFNVCVCIANQGNKLL